MRNTLFSVLLISAYFLLAGQKMPNCEDPNPYTIITDCGTEIDLCIDRYIMNNDEREKELKVFSNDMGLIDPSLCYICRDCSHGELTQLPNYNFMYSPDPGFVGMDTFYYAIVIYDTCMIESYCEPGDGKIWSIQSVFTGPDNSRIEVYSKNADNWEFVDEVKNINHNDYFWIDGSHLPVNQANWKFNIYLPGESDPEIVDVHTSCSEDILGKDFGYFRTITGCIAPQYEKEDCNINEEYRYQLDTRSSYLVSTIFEDETMVVIEVLDVLAIDYSGFNVLAGEGENKITWNLDFVTNEDYIELEKSYNGLAFFTIKSYPNAVAGFYEFLDPLEAGVDEYYYRLSIVDSNGSKRYSQIISITNKLYEDIVRVYPNPVFSTIQLNAENSLFGIIEFEIWDLDGKLILKKFTESSKKIILSTKDLMDIDGIYFINIVLENGQHISKKVFALNQLQ